MQPQHQQGKAVGICFRGAARSLLFVLLLLSSTSGYSLSEVEKLVHAKCVKCHGVDGKTKVDNWPNLNCQNRGYLYQRLIGFRSNPDHDIDKAVKELSITDIDLVSKYYSSAKCSGN